MLQDESIEEQSHHQAATHSTANDTASLYFCEQPCPYEAPYQSTQSCPRELCRDCQEVTTTTESHGVTGTEPSRHRATSTANEEEEAASSREAHENDGDVEQSITEERHHEPYRSTTNTASTANSALGVSWHVVQHTKHKYYRYKCTHQIQMRRQRAPPPAPWSNWEQVSRVESSLSR